MDSGDQIENLFTEARSLPTGKRSEFLDKVCAENCELRAELESLLQADEEAEMEGFMQEPVIRLRAGAESTVIHKTYELEESLINHFKIIKKLGSGGMGVIYKARDLQLNRFVALKFLFPHLNILQSAKKRFKQEAKAASSLDHPNICTIYEIGETDKGFLYIVMPCYEGETLKELTNGRRLSIPEILNYIRQIAYGLQAAHEKGIIHRDIKPMNILVTKQGLVKVLDFGIAKVTGPDLTSTERPVGTIAYMSPEQVAGKHVDARTDIWSLGVVFYELLTGRFPFGGTNMYRIMDSILHGDPTAVSILNPGSSELLNNIIFRCLEKNPVNRFKSINEFLDDLDHIQKVVTGQEINSPGIKTIRVRDGLVGSGYSRSAIYGRNQQLSTLHQCFKAAQNGQRQIIFISAEAGMGKTTLVNKFLEELEYIDEVFTGRGICLEHRGEGEPYMPVLEVLNSLCKTPLRSEFIELFKSHAPTWLIQMPWLIDDSDFETLQRKVEGTTRIRMLREFLELIERMTHPYPCVMFIEDLHWCDYSTVQLLDGIARCYEPARLMVIGTYRPSLLKSEGHPLYSIEQELNLSERSIRINLPLLNQRETEAFIKNLLESSEYPASIPLLVHQRTDGHPLFIRHVVEYWKENKLLIEDEESHWIFKTGRNDLSFGIPETLRKLIEQQMIRLEPEDRNLLEIASIVGKEFSQKTVATCVNEEENYIEERFTELSRREQFISKFETGDNSAETIYNLFQFRHHLYQEVLYNRIMAGFRMNCHKSIGNFLEKIYRRNLMDHTLELALHFTRGHQPGKAVKYLAFAANRAFQRSAYNEAIEHLRKALGLLQMLPANRNYLKKEIEIQMMLGTACIAVYGWASPEAERAYLQGKKLAIELNGIRYLIPLLFRLATMYEFRGKYSKSRKLLEESLDLSESMEDDSTLLDSRYLMACTTFHQGDFSAALKHAREALKLYTPQKHISLLNVYGVDPGVSSHDWAALSLWFLGYPDKAEKEAMKAVRTAEYHQYSLACAQVRAAWLFQCMREIKQVEKWAEEAIRMAGDKGFVYHQAFGNILLGWSLCMQNQVEKGMEFLKKGIDDCHEMGAKMDEPFFKALLAEIYGNCGLIDEGIRELDEALWLLKQTRSYFYEAEIYRLKGEMLIKSNQPGNREKARSCYQTGLRIAREKKSLSLELRSAIGLCRLADSGSDFEEARRILEGVYYRYKEGFQTPDLIEAEKLLNAPVM